MRLRKSILDSTLRLIRSEVRNIKSVEDESRCRELGVSRSSEFQIGELSAFDISKFAESGVF